MLKISIKKIIFSTIACCLLVFSCAKKQEIIANTFLEKGLKYAKEKKYDFCVQNLSKIDENFPYSPESKTAMPVLIYCHYMNGDYETIYPMIESFRSLYPNSDQIPYLYYIKALSYFRAIKSHRKSMEIVKNLEETIFALYEIDSESQYAKNLVELLPFIEKMKMNNQMYAVQYYVSQQDYISAAKRYSEMLSHNLNEENRTKIEESLGAVLKNMGVKLEK